MRKNISWRAFREQYSALHLCMLRSKIDAESRLNVIERILRPKRLADVATTVALQRLQLALLSGVESRAPAKGMGRVDKPRSPHTVRTYMAVIIAALRWADYMGMIESAPKLRRLKTSKLRHMKGRPLTATELQDMLNATEGVVGEDSAESWRYMLRGLWASGLRLGELMHVHWSNDRYIVPTWPNGILPVLQIPATMQKNETEESIPLLPEFERVLIETPVANRSDWAFSPTSLQRRVGRSPKQWRVSREWAGRVISEIGLKAGIVVQPAGGGHFAKYASAHDFRRSCADRLVEAGVPEREVSRIMRHSSVDTTRRYYASGNVQRSAKLIRDCLASIN